MKIKLLLFCSLLISCLNAFAQEPKAPIDESKRIGYSLPSAPLKATFIGEIHTPGVDLKWQPLLTHKIQWSEPIAPNEKLLDSIVAAKTRLKQTQLERNKKTPDSISSINPTIGHNFQGNMETGFSPLDDDIAISNAGIIVSVSNTLIQYYDTLGNNTYTSDIASFLNVAGVSSVCDPVVLYDAGSDRFIFFCQQYPFAPNDKVMLCFSQTNNPAAGWWIYTLSGDPLNVGDGFDYPKMAVSNNEVFISGNLYNEQSGNFDQAMVYQVDKTEGYSGGTINYEYWTGITGSPFTLLPVSYGQKGSYGPGIYLVSIASGGGSSINLYDITNDIYHSPVINYYDIATTPYSLSGDAAQKGTSCQLNCGLGSCRALSGFYLNGIIHFVFHCDIGSGWCGINYNRLNVAGQTDQSAEVGDLGTYDYAYPSVVSYATSPNDASVMIGFGISGPGTYPSVGVINCDNSMKWSPNTVVVKQGINYVSYTSNKLERWGDYSGTSRFHSGTSPTVWMNGMYGTNTKYWSTWIAEIIGKNANGINELTNNTGTSAKVYPNPIVNTFNLEFTLTANTNLNISVTDINGKTVKQLYSGQGQKGDNNFSFNKANLAAGIYFLVIKSEEEIIKSQKIIVTN